MTYDQFLALLMEKRMKEELYLFSLSEKKTLVFYADGPVHHLDRSGSFLVQFSTALKEVREILEPNGQLSFAFDDVE